MGRLPKVHEQYRTDGHFLLRLENSIYLDERISREVKEILCPEIRRLGGDLLIVLDNPQSIIDSRKAHKK